MSTRKRRSYGAGSIFFDGKYYRAAAELGRGLDGKRKRKVVTGKTQKEVADKLKAIHSLIEQGKPVTNDKTKTGDFLDTWLKDVVKAHKSPGTYRSYEEKVRVHIKPAIGHIPLALLSVSDVQRFLNDKTKHSDLSSGSVERIRAVLRAALTTAERWEIVHRNVAKLTTIPKVHREEIQPFTDEEVKKLLDALEDHRLGAYYTVALAIGLRPGEAMGLVWNDIDLESKPPMIHVRMGLQRVDGKPRRVPLKTERSRRSIPLPDICVTALKKHREMQAKEKANANSWDEKGFVFTTPRGTPLDQSNMSHQFGWIQKKAKIPHRRAYDMRHTAATMLLKQGVPARVVMEILGHSSITLTMNTYTHVMPTMMTEAMKGMNQHLQG